MLRTLILPLALVSGLSLAAASTAQASPTTTAGSRIAWAPLGGVRVGVGVGIGIPLGGGHRHSYGPSGYWTTQMVPMTVPVTVPYQLTVQVPDHVIGTDVNGQPIWTYRTEVQTQYRTEYQTQYVPQQVWVQSAPVYYRSRPTVHLGLGFLFR